jgi:hypothetical protein
MSRWCGGAIGAKEQEMALWWRATMVSCRCSSMPESGWGRMHGGPHSCHARWGAGEFNVDARETHHVVEGGEVV